MIRKLSSELQSHLRSGVAIASISQCMEELVLNSLDAGATCIAVRVDINRCMVQVVDNGSGITKEQLDCIPNRYCYRFDRFCILMLTSYV